MKPEQIEHFFGITYRTWQNWKKEKRPVVDFFQKYQDLIETFLEKGHIDKLETFSYIQDPIFEDYVITNLKSVKNINRNFLNLWSPSREFLTRNLKKFNISQEDFSANEAKEKLIKFLSDAELSMFADSKNKQKEAIEFVQNNISNIEAYILLKYPEKFTS